jgi:hypothetical protein
MHNEPAKRIGELLPGNAEVRVPTKEIRRA